MRLTADGQLRSCLFARTESDLRAPAARRAPPTPSWPTQMQRLMATKLPGHGIDDPGFLQPDRPMSAIGG